MHSVIIEKMENRDQENRRHRRKKRKNMPYKQYQRKLYQIDTYLKYTLEYC